MFKSAKRWLNLFRRANATTRHRRPRWRIALETLEDRNAPATHTWTGLSSANSNWSEAANWDAAGVPTGGLEGGAFADLVFPAGAARTTNLNNLVISGGGLAQFRSITIAGSNYDLGGNGIALGDPDAAQNVALNVGAGALNVDLNFANIRLSGQTGSKQFFVVNAGADATVGSELTNAFGSVPELTKSGTGVLILAHDNNQFQGPISLESNGGVVTIRHVNALGAAAAGTVVDVNSTLQLEIPGGGVILEPLILNGAGQVGSGALLNISGDNTWAGTVGLDSNSAIGNDGAGVLTITGVISDLGAGHDLAKEGPGQLIFTADNTYRGLTTINNGILTIQHAHALGASGTSQSGTIVNRNPNIGTTGTLQVQAVAPSNGFVVFNELLTLNGRGANNDGSLANVGGNNNWAGDVILGSAAPNGHDVSIGAAVGTNLIISGIISNPNGGFTLTKADAGRIIFNNANTYGTQTTVAEGILTIRDSLSLGPANSSNTIVQDGATLQLEVDFNFLLGSPPGSVWNEGPDPRGRDLVTDSVTGTDDNGPQLGLTITEPLLITGLGSPDPFDPTSRLGALHSKTGINIWQRTITLQGLAPQNIAAIGVDRDRFQSTDNNYFTHDYSLTIGRDPQTPSGLPLDIAGNNTSEFHKLRDGHLILDEAFSYTGITRIQEGWVTIRDNQSLGARIPGRGDTSQNGTFVAAGAALHLKPKADLDLNLVENLTLAGAGVTHNFALINQKGALMSLGGDNVVGRRVDSGVAIGSDIRLDGVVGIGVEHLPGPDPWKVSPAPAQADESELTITGSLYDASAFGAASGPGGFDKFGSRRLVLQGDGSYSGANRIQEGIVLVQHDSALGRAGTGTTSGTQTFNISNTTVAVGAGLQFMHGIAENNGGIEAGVNVLDEHLILNGSGVLIHTAGPAVGGTFTVRYDNTDSGGSLSTTPALAYNLPGSGGVTPTSSLQNALNALPSIIEVGGVTVTKTGNVYRVVFLGTPAGTDNADRMTAVGSGGAAIVTVVINNPASNLGNVPGPNVPVQSLSDDHMWRGPVTLNTNSTINIAQNSRFTIFGSIKDGTASAGLTVNSGVNTANPTLDNIGELVLGGTNILPTGVTQFSDYDGLTDIRAGVVTIMHGQALGSAAGGTVVADGATLQLQGAITVAGEALTLQGAGLGTPPTNVPARWFGVGPSPINNGQTPGSQAVSGRITGIAVDPTDSNVIYISTAGGGAWKTENNGRTWMQIFDTLQTQTLYLPTNTAGQFTLTFPYQPTPSSPAGETTIALDFNSGTLAQDIEDALNALPNIGSLAGQAGFVDVVRSPANSLLFKITFGGALAAIIVPQLTATTTTAGISDPVVASNTSVTYTGAIAVDPNDPRIVYLGTGEANNSTDSYYGTGVYQSLDSGRTWTLLTEADGSNPLYGLAVSKIVVDFGPPNTPFTPPQPNWVAGQTGNNPTGRIYVATSNNAANAPVTATAGVYRFDTSTTQTQTLTVPTRTGAGQFTLTFQGDTTPTALNLNSTTLAQDIEDALNALPTMFTQQAFVQVSSSTVNSNVFYITFMGPLLGNGPSPRPTPVPVMGATGTGAPDPVVTASSTWVNLTAGITGPRRVHAGAPNNAGPDDDFRRMFPQGTGVVWSDLSLTYIDILQPRGSTNFVFRPVLYAALGIPGGNINNAVYRTEAPNVAAGNTTFVVPTAWFVGQPAAQVTEVQEIRVPLSPSPRTFTLSFPALGNVETTAFSNTTAGDVLRDQIAQRLNGLSTIQGGGGHVSVVRTDTGGAEYIFRVTFAGTLQYGNMPTLVEREFNTDFNVVINTLTGGAGIDDRGGGFPGGPFGGGRPLNGMIKLSTFTTSNFPSRPRLANVFVYASVAFPEDPPQAPHGQLRSIERSASGGESWTSTNLPPNFMGLNSGNTAAMGWYAQSIFASSATNVFVGGEQFNIDTHVGFLFQTIDSGTNWTDISAGPAVPPVTTDQGPHSAVHAMAVDINTGAGGTRRLIVGTDGGLWRLDNAAAANIDWTDINGDLAVAQFNDVAVHPNDPNIALAGLQGNGVARFTGSAAWTRASVPAANPGRAGEGGQVAFNPNNPNLAYAVFVLNGQGIPDLAAANTNSVLHRSVDGGLTWIPTSRAFRGTHLPFVVDSVNPARILAGGADLGESLNNGVSFTTFANTSFSSQSVTAVAAAAIQGKFVADPFFTQVGDKGTNVYDRDTIYVVANNNSIHVTKDHGQSWQVRTGPWGGTAVVVDIAVDAGNRDVAYVVIRNFTGGAHIWRTTNAGQSWTNITGTLPNIPVWKIVVDPRHDPADPSNPDPARRGSTGNLYVGTDDGVFRLPDQPLMNTTYPWRSFGSGMANVQVHDLELNQSLNMLTAGSYGRSLYQFILTDVPPAVPPATPALPASVPVPPQPVYGALRAVSGSSFWTGAITLGRDIDTIVTAAGSQALQNGISAAQLNIVGSISDAPGAGTPGNLIKVGQGNVVFSGDNTYDGVTHVGQGVLIVQSKTALGSDLGNTIIHEATMLELQSDLELEPILAFGHGVKFNEHFQGALFNSTNFNTYTGELTLGLSATYPLFNPALDTFNFNESVTIGVASGSQLTIGNNPFLAAGPATITDGADNLALIKELTGTLVLANANTYGDETAVTLLRADTFVSQGALRVMDNEALGGSANGTTVLNGAQLQIESPAAGPSVVITDEHLWLSGTGIDGGGALLNTGGDNEWLAPLSLDDEPGLQPDQPAAGIVAIGVQQDGDTLIIAPPGGGGIDELKRVNGNTVPSGIDKVGPGTLSFTSDNNYSGGVFVTEGILNVQHPGALAGTGVNEIQRVTVTGPASSPGLWRLTFNGRTTGNLGFGTAAVNVKNALDGLLSVAGVGGTVSVVRLNEIVTPSDTHIWVYTVAFDGGSFAGVDQPMMSGLTTTASTQVFVSKVADGGFGTRVADGAALQLENLSGPMDAEAVALNGAGVGAAGALHNVAGNNVWTGDVYLQSSTTINTPDGTMLTIGSPGVPGLSNHGIRDPHPAPVPAATLTKIGDGALVLPDSDSLVDSNPYSGRTIVEAGVVNVRDGGGLGRSTETQLITLVPPNPSALPVGGFQLQFNGSASTPARPFGVTAAQIQTDLNALPEIQALGGGGGFVTVTRTGNVFTVVFHTADPSVPVRIGSEQLLVATPGTNFGVRVNSVFETQSITVIGANGTFRLAFNGGTTNPATHLLNVLSPTLAQDMQDALNDLSQINNFGSVFVNRIFDPSGSPTNVYHVTFRGDLALSNQNPITVASTTGGAIILTNTVSNGPEGTLVTDGTAVEVQGGINVAAEHLTLNGAGVLDAGALVNVADDNAWGGLITLGSNSVIGVAGATDTLTVTGVITDGTSVRSLTKVGPGTLTYQGTAHNTYQGLTQVNEGTLLLNMGLGMPFQGDLTVGDNTGGLAVTRLAIGSSDQIPDTAFTTVLGDGHLDINHQNDLIIEVHVLNGLVTTGSGILNVTALLNQDGDVDVDDGQLFVGTLDLIDGRITVTDFGFVAVFGLNMTGGVIDLVDATTSLALGNGVVATASSGPALITGAGTVDLGSAARTFTVNNAISVATDLHIEAPIVGAGSIIKAGDGTLELDSDFNAYVGGTRIDDGVVQVDGAIGDVELNGGTLAGDDSPGLGQVGNVTTISGGAIAPGNSPGTLHVAGNATLDAAVTILFDLERGVGVPPGPDGVAGIDWDVLDVSGVLDLNGAVLGGLVGPDVLIGHSFVIITAGTVDGQFAGGDTAFIDGQKFLVQYNLNPSGPDTVVLTRVRNNVEVTVASSVNPSVWGQEVGFTATLIPEQFTGPIPDGTPIEFVLTGPGIPTSITFVTGLVGQQATFAGTTPGTPLYDALVAAGLSQGVLEIAPIGSEYQLTVNFAGTPDFNPDSTDEPLLQVVNKASTEINVISSLNPSTFGESVTFTADVDPIPPGGAVPGTDDFTVGGGTVTFFVDGVPQTPIAVNAAGVADITLPSLSVGEHLISAAYNGDSHFFGSTTATDLSQQVNKQSTTTTVSAVPSPVDAGQNVTFSVHVAAGIGVPTGTVVITDGGEVQRVTIAGSSGTFTLTFDGSPTDPLAFDASANAVRDALNALASIGGVGGTVSVTKNANVYTVTFLGDLVGLNLPQMTAAGSAGATVTTVSNGGNSFGSTSLDSNGDAAFTINTLPIGLHTIYVKYQGDLNYNPSFASTPLVVRGFTTMSASASPSPSSVGQEVDFVASLAGVAPLTVTPTGNVEFYDGAVTPANLLGAGALDASGVARFDNFTGLAFGSHTISAHYVGDGNYVPNTTTFAHFVKAATSVGVAADPSPSILNQQITITATVTSPSGTPAGTVNFYNGAITPANQIGSSTLNASGVGTMVISSLPIAVHTINVRYEGNATFAANTGTMTHAVRSATNTSIVSSRNPAAYGQQITFTATVTQVSGATLPTGFVDFVDDLTATVIGDDIPLSGGVASINISNLPAGTHPIRAVYSGATLFAPSTGNLNPQQVVNQGITTTSLTATPSNPTTYGQQITFTATVTVLGPAIGPADGTVDFLDGNTIIGNDIPVSGGVATFNFSLLSAGIHSNIRAQYNGTINFAASTSNAISRTVNKANTTIQLDSTFNPSVYGQTAIVATVSPVAPGGGTTAGSVTFFVTNLANGQETQTTINFSSGAATLTPTLNVGSYSIQARYNGNINYNASAFSNIINPQVVNQADSSTTVTTTGTPSVYGTAVIRATVAAVAPGAGTPTGQVVFHVTGGPSAGDYTVSLSGGAATLPQTLDVGTYTITVDYLGDTNFKTSSGALAAQQVVTQAGTTVQVTSNHNPSVFGQEVTFTATVNVVSPGVGTPPGSVDFVIDGNTLGDDVSLNTSGQATFSISSLSVSGSPHTVVVIYNGNLNFGTSAGSLSGDQVVNKGNVVGNVVSTNPSQLVGQPLTLTATFQAASPAVGVPTGFADLLINGVPVSGHQNQPLNGSGSVSFSLNPNTLPQGNHNVQVHYDGDGNFNAGDSAVLVQQIRGDVALDVSSDNNPSDFGESVTFTVFVSAVSPAAGTPSGSVDFLIDGDVVGDNVSLSNFAPGVARAIFETTSIHASGSPHAVAVHYNGDTFFFEGDGDLADGQTVAKVDTSVSVSSSDSASVFGQPVIITANISRDLPGAGLPDGTANLIIDGFTVQNVNVVDGVATFAAISDLPVAGSTHSIQVDYLGSGDFNASSDSLTGGQAVSPAATTTTVAATPNPSVPQQNVTFVATVQAQLPSAATPTGFVRFFIDGVAQVPDQPLSGGQASLTTNSLTLGTHTVSAEFLGTPNLLGSTGNLPNQQVNPNPVVFAIVPTSVKSGTAFTVVVQYRNGANIDTSFNGPVSLGLAAGPAGGALLGSTTVNASNGIAVFSLVLPKAGAYNLSASANGLPPVISSTIHSTALGLAVSVTPRRIFTNQLFTINAVAFDATGGVATNYNGAGFVSILKKPAGGKIRGVRVGTFANGSTQLFLKVTKSGTYRFRLTGPDGLIATIRIVIRGRRSSST